MRALVLHRDPEVRGRLERALRGRGHDVTCCAGVEEAARELERQAHGLLMLEWSPPVWPGLEVCRRALPVAAGQRRVVLALFDVADPDEGRTALAQGADGWLAADAEDQALEDRLAAAERRALSAGLRSAERRSLLSLEKAVETIQVGAVVTDLEGRIVYLNPAEARQHGYSRHELIGCQARIMAPRETWRDLTREELRRTGPWRREGTQVRKDGTTFPAQLLSDVVRDARGEPIGVVTLCEDISDRKRVEEELRSSEERYSLAVRGANDGIWDWNLATGAAYFSPRWKEMLGHDDDEIGARIDEWFGRVHPEDLPRVRRKIDQHCGGLLPHFEDEHRMRRKDGTYRWVSTRGFAVRDVDGRPQRMAGAQTDVTDRRAHDALTGLPNRAIFMERLARASARARRDQGHVFAVLFLDLDGFKRVNDDLGHMAGDQVLVSVARRLENFVRPVDTVARLGGDEFVVLLDGIGGEADARRVADRMSGSLRDPFHVEGRDVPLSASIGIAVSRGEHAGAEEVLRTADAAMYRAKSAVSGRAPAPGGGPKRRPATKQERP